MDALARDLDLNLLRVLVVVADEGSVTAAAARLYVTQPAVSAALTRLGRALGAPVVTRQGRKIALTARGRRLLEVARPHLRAILDGVARDVAFDPRTAAKTFKVGMSDDVELWLLPALLQRLAARAPGVRLIVTPVQFRTVNDALARAQIDLAITVADDAPPSVQRRAIAHGGFAVLYDPRHVAWKTLTEKAYFAHAHVIVSYNGDLRGIVEDALGRARTVACAVSRFAPVGALVNGTALLATVPARMAARFAALHPPLRTAKLPFTLPVYPLELLWNRVDDDDPAHAFLREEIVAAAGVVSASPRARAARGAPTRRPRSR